MAWKGTCGKDMGVLVDERYQQDLSKRAGGVMQITIHRGVEHK